MNPIKTIITNKTAASKTIHWAGKDTKWLPAHGETTVPFELWSVANDAQRTAIKTAVSNGSVSLSLRVLGDNGEYTTVPFNPCGAPVNSNSAAAPVKELDTLKQQVAEMDHTVRVVSTETSNIMGAYGAKASVPGTDDEPLPIRELKNGTPESVGETTEEATVKQESEKAATEEQPAETKKRRSKKAE